MRSSDAFYMFNLIASLVYAGFLTMYSFIVKLVEHLNVIFESLSFAFLDLFP